MSIKKVQVSKVQLLNREPQNRRISNRKIPKGGFASLNLFKKTECLPSKFNIDEIVKSHLQFIYVIPAKAGIQ